MPLFHTFSQPKDLKSWCSSLQYYLVWTRSVFVKWLKASVWNRKGAVGTADYTDCPSLDSYPTVSVISILGIAQLPSLLRPHKAVTNVLAGVPASSEAQGHLASSCGCQQKSWTCSCRAHGGCFFRIGMGAADLTQHFSPSLKGLALIKSGIPTVFSLMN